MEVRLTDTRLSAAACHFGQALGFVWCISAIVLSPNFCFAQDSSPTQSPTAGDVLDLLEAEALDTVSLDRPVFFESPTGKTAIAQAGIYRVEPAEGAGLRLIPAKGSQRDVLILQALAVKHADAIATPMALSVPETEDSLHVVLLLPGGKALEAVGTYSAVHTRGSMPSVLSSAQLHEAFLRKQAGQVRPNNPATNRSSPTLP